MIVKIKMEQNIKHNRNRVLRVREYIDADVEKYFVQLNDIGNDLNHYKSDAQVQEDILDIVDEHFSSIVPMKRIQGNGYDDEYERL